MAGTASRYRVQLWLWSSRDMPQCHHHACETPPSINWSRHGLSNCPLSSSCHSIGRQEAMDDSKPSHHDSSLLNSRRPVQPDIKKHASSSPTSLTFGKTAIVILLVAVVAYMYQVCE
jgi:hypothetical protein